MLQADAITLVRDALAESLLNFDLEQPYKHARAAIGLLTEQHSVTHAQLAAAVMNVTVDSWRAWLEGDSITGSSSSNGAGLEPATATAYVYGDVDVTRARQYIAAMHETMIAPESGFHSEPPSSPTSATAYSTLQNTKLALVLSPLPRIYALPANRTYAYQRLAPNAADANHAALVQFPACTYSNRTCRAVLAVAGAAVAEPAFDALRTRQQLGYAVSAGDSTQVRTVASLSVIVQGAASGSAEKGTHNAVFLEQRIQAFLQEDFYTQLLFTATDAAATIDAATTDVAADEWIAAIVASTSAACRAAPLNADEAFDRDWNELLTCGSAVIATVHDVDADPNNNADRDILATVTASRACEWDRAERDAAAIERVTRADVRQWWREYVLNADAQRRRLTVHIFGTTEAENGATTQVVPAQIVDGSGLAAADVSLSEQSYGAEKTHWSLWPAPAENAWGNCQCIASCSCLEEQRHRNLPIGTGFESKHEFISTLPPQII